MTMDHTHSTPAFERYQDVSRSGSGALSGHSGLHTAVAVPNASPGSSNPTTPTAGAGVPGMGLGGFVASAGVGAAAAAAATHTLTAAMADGGASNNTAAPVSLGAQAGGSAAAAKVRALL